jgi:hypothetical protein
MALSISFPRKGFVMSVSTIPGHTQFTRISYLAYSNAHTFVSKTSAAFEAVMHLPQNFQMILILHQMKH